MGMGIHDDMHSHPLAHHPPVDPVAQEKAQSAVRGWGPLAQRYASLTKPQGPVEHKVEKPKEKPPAPSGPPASSSSHQSSEAPERKSATGPAAPAPPATTAADRRSSSTSQPSASSAAGLGPDAGPPGRRDHSAAHSAPRPPPWGGVKRSLIGRQPPELEVTFAEDNRSAPRDSAAGPAGSVGVAGSPEAASSAGEASGSSQAPTAAPSSKPTHSGQSAPTTSSVSSPAAAAAPAPAATAATVTATATATSPPPNSSSATTTHPPPQTAQQPPFASNLSSIERARLRRAEEEKRREAEAARARARANALAEKLERERKSKEAEDHTKALSHTQTQSKPQLQPEADAQSLAGDKPRDESSANGSVSPSQARSRPSLSPGSLPRSSQGRGRADSGREAWKTSLPSRPAQPRGARPASTAVDVSVGGLTDAEQHGLLHVGTEQEHQGHGPGQDQKQTDPASSLHLQTTSKGQRSRGELKERKGGRDRQWNDPHLLMPSISAGPGIPAGPELDRFKAEIEAKVRAELVLSAEVSPTSPGHRTENTQNKKREDQAIQLAVLRAERDKLRKELEAARHQWQTQPQSQDQNQPLTQTHPHFPQNTSAGVANERTSKYTLLQRPDATSASERDILLSPPQPKVSLPGTHAGKNASPRPAVSLPRHHISTDGVVSSRPASTFTETRTPSVCAPELRIEAAAKERRRWPPRPPTVWAFVSRFEVPMDRKPVWNRFTVNLPPRGMASSKRAPLSPDVLFHLARKVSRNMNSRPKRVSIQTDPWADAHEGMASFSSRTAPITPPGPIPNERWLLFPRLPRIPPVHLSTCRLPRSLTPRLVIAQPVSGSVVVDELDVASAPPDQEWLEDVTALTGASFSSPNPVSTANSTGKDHAKTSKREVESGASRTVGTDRGASVSSGPEETLGSRRNQGAGTVTGVTTTRDQASFLSPSSARIALPGKSPVTVTRSSSPPPLKTAPATSKEDSTETAGATPSQADSRSSPAHARHESLLPSTPIATGSDSLSWRRIAPLTGLPATKDVAATTVPDSSSSTISHSADSVTLPASVGIPPPVSPSSRLLPQRLSNNVPVRWSALESGESKTEAESPSASQRPHSSGVGTIGGHSKHGLPPVPQSLRAGEGLASLPLPPATASQTSSAPVCPTLPEDYCAY